jgi:GNS1/SUR4 family
MTEAVHSVFSEYATAMAVVKPTTLPRSLLKFPPSSRPSALPPPSDHPTLAHPFIIPADIYEALLSPAVPITIAIIYASVASYMNVVNRQRKNKPWAFSQTSVFKCLVILHNVILAVYSAWTFVGMTNALALSFAGWRGDYGIAGVLDSLCKIHGPRGMGNGATFNETSYAWTMTNQIFHLAADELAPERTDVGRIWNEGLAFYGWIFYLSKFYEVIDTAIILSKGKKSSLLQTYHHAGAMLCMWAGIRYMSPPIWMFVLVNSGIHAVMVCRSASDGYCLLTAFSTPSIFALLLA